ncbi:MAG TPA: DUF2249 domain-containing protein [Azoarcus taiwanensis]|uniref:DUF2249 domain-containing protein n=1 Tax=Azoarcus taiwanensis TaxID=666964 RepID=A0A972FG18_9RHOO|nr:DUF2249 domain-containing protein [Azoarcus taiwanensis]NMG04908.1 DUF2249 domain-containing protein [Azoarcus taiwanensis]HRQ55888.1 DUF2249 domain-containing protein [Azoarcus taiwanensis]
MSELPILDNTTFAFDARGVAKRFRHAAIFGALESLHDGETMRFVNDHDPVPLLQQIEQRYGKQVAIEYVTRNPGEIVIHFTITITKQEAAPAAAAAAGTQAGGCGGGGGGCGCAGQ